MTATAEQMRRDAIEAYAEHLGKLRDAHREQVERAAATRLEITEVRKRLKALKDERWN